MSDAWRAWYLFREYSPHFGKVFHNWNRNNYLTIDPKGVWFKHELISSREARCVTRRGGCVRSQGRSQWVWPSSVFGVCLWLSDKWNDHSVSSGHSTVQSFTNPSIHAFALIQASRFVFRCNSLIFRRGHPQLFFLATPLSAVHALLFYYTTITSSNRQGCEFSTEPSADARVMYNDQCFEEFKRQCVCPQLS